ncbi:MAG TPA: sodium transporter [bacterium]|nr:sodium transporter [bacterium]
MRPLDWTVLAVYLAGILGMGFLIGRRQRDQSEYYVAGETMPWWQVGLSLVANQVSAVSLIGAPAFIAVKSGGGLKWLQYEMAVPLAMIAIIVILLPAYWKSRGFTIYGYLDDRFGAPVRLAVSAVFLLSRSMGTGVALLATSYVTAVCLDVGLTATIALVGAASVLYTIWGGIRADIYSDIVQLAVLWAAALVCGVIIVLQIPDGGWDLSFWRDRLAVFEFSRNGITDGATFSFWPMLFGGLFLYLSYYGCDQTQAQRLLSTKGPGESAKALALNGILRFPLVLTYCAVGVLMLPFMASHPDFSAQVASLPPDYLMPTFFLHHVPTGFLGLIIAGVFAASMSSIDSAVNSLSAASWNDFLVRFRPSLDLIADRAKVRWSRFIAAFWGGISILFALWLGGGHDTVIELVNKIGSAFYGPVAAVFVVGILFASADGRGALAGLAAGVAVNIYLWIGHGGTVSWMWWNLIGFVVCLAVSLLFSSSGNAATRVAPSTRMIGWLLPLLLGWFVLIVLCGLLIHTWR